MTQLPIKPGIDGLPTNTIPTDPAAFVDWFKNSYLPRWAANADIRNATPGVGVQISGNPQSPGFVGFEEITGLSVLGNPTVATGDVQAITASADGQFLQRAAGALVFGPVAVVAAASITGVGSPASPLELVNDSSSPGGLLFYSTDPSGNKGWFSSSTPEFNITPDTHPAIPVGIGLGPNDEFEAGNSIDTAGTRYTGAIPWTAFNISTGSGKVSHGSLALFPALSLALSMNGFSQPLTNAATWSYTTKMVIQLNNPGAFGIFLGVGPTGKFWHFNVVTTNTIEVQSFNSPTSFNGTAASATTTINLLGVPIYLRIAFDGTNLLFSFSSSGNENTYTVLLSTTLTGFLGSPPTLIGVCGQLQSAATQNVSIYDWFRRTG